MKATREKQERFVESFGRLVAVNTVRELMRQHGLEWLTDDQMSEVVSEIAANVRASQRFNIRNRNRRSA